MFRQPPHPSPFDRFDWRGIFGKPYISVSGNGIKNGKSNIPNDGADYGIDTPNTTTSGLKEAILKGNTLLLPVNCNGSVFEIADLIDVSVNYMVLRGISKDQTIIRLSSTDKGFIIQTALDTTKPVYVEIRNIGFDQYNSTNNTFQLNASPISSSVNGGEATIDGCSFYTTGTHNFGTVLIQGDQATNIGFNPIRFTNNEMLRDPTLANVGGDFVDMYGSPNILATGNIFKDVNGNPCLVVAGQVPVENVIVSDNVGRITNSIGNNSNFVSIYPVANNSQVYHNVLVIGNTLYTEDKASYNWESLVLADGSNTSYTIANNATIEHLMMVGNSTNGSYHNNIYNNFQTAIVLSQVITKGYNGAFTPTITPTTPVSGTSYQNKNPFDIILYPSAYNNGSTNGYILVEISADNSTFIPIIKDIVATIDSSSLPRTVVAKVPALWWYRVTITNSTMQNAAVVAD